MKLKEVLCAARKKIFDSAPPAAFPTSVFYGYDVHWAYAEWNRFLESHGITKNPNNNYLKVEGGSMEPDLYIPPDVANKMLVLGHLP